VRIQSAIGGFAIALARSASAGYALQEFTVDEARIRIERLEARGAIFEIANREGPTYGRADLEAAGWAVHLSIGE
jgi:hypothetical protein